MQNIKEIKIGRYLIKVGEFPDGFHFNIFTHDKSLFDKGVEATEAKAIDAARSMISQQKLAATSPALTGLYLALPNGYEA